MRRGRIGHGGILTAARQHGQWFDELIPVSGQVTKDGPSAAASVVPLIRNGECICVDAIGIGFSCRMKSSVGTAADGGSPLVTLCENVLRTLGQRPKRIYEGKHDDITPANAVATAAKDGISVVKDAMQAVTGGAKF